MGLFNHYAKEEDGKFVIYIIGVGYLSDKNGNKNGRPMILLKQDLLLGCFDEIRVFSTSGELSTTGAELSTTNDKSSATNGKLSTTNGELPATDKEFSTTNGEQVN